jgi:hypothetical protein
MCTGPVSDNQSYWGLIQIKISGNQMPVDQLDDFKRKLTAFLNNHTESGLPQNASASLANGAIKTDDAEDGTSIQLINRNV